MGHSEDKETCTKVFGHERTLTDADVQAIAVALELQLTENFYRDLGKGVMGIVKKVVLLALIGIASYGAMRGIKP